MWQDASVPGGNVMHPFRCAAILMLLALPGRADAQLPERLVVVELFTSQGCSSCPPADALLTELARTEPGLLALGLHVTYWDRLGWRDPYALPAATARQRGYAAQFVQEGVYTPQMVVDGTRQAVGSDRAAVRAAIQEARMSAEAQPALQVTTDGARLRVQSDRSLGASILWLVGFDPQHSTVVGAGENGGRTLQETNVVRALVRAGDTAGAPLDLAVARPAGVRVAALLQAGADGRILAAALLP